VESDNVLRVEFEIFRKPSFSGVSIHRQSYHPQSHATINSAIHRLLSIPLKPVAYEAEIQQIEQIAKTNGFTANIRLLVTRKRLRKLLHDSDFACNNEVIRKEKWIRLPFLDRPSEKLSVELRLYGYLTGFYPATSIRDLIIYQRSCA